MLKKGLVAVGLAGLLVVPFGIALAEDAPADDGVVPAAQTDRDQVRDRDRVQDPTVCGTCSAQVEDAAVVADRDRDRDQVRDRLHQTEAVGTQQQLQERYRLHEGDGDLQVRERAREHVTMQNGPGEMHQNGAGPQGFGNGPGSGG